MTQPRWTATQGRVLAFLHAFFQKEDQLPPAHIIAAEFGWASPNNAALHLQALERHGAIEKNAVGKYRFSASQKTRPHTAGALVLHVVDPLRIRRAAQQRNEVTHAGD